ncbi:MAG: flagellar filament capping protein FliD [Alphaproteobacteria bacterium]|nr:flagellar filament capping protein FliD [Alphaproteobacteria bacterium]
MTTISTGTLATSGTTTYVYGTASELDTSALVETAVAAKTQKADQIDIKIDENDAKISAYEELSDLAQALQDSLEQLKSVTGLSEDNESIFNTRTGTLQSDSSTDPTSLVSVSVDDGSELGDYTIVVQQKATAMKVTGSEQASKTDALGYSGSFTIGLSDSGTASLDITATMSLTDIADVINAQTATTGVKASIIKTSETGYSLVLTGQNTAQDIQITSVSGDDVMTSLGITDGSGGFQNITQQARQAIITVDGVTITRDTNTFDDVIDGVQIDVKGADPGTTISMSVTHDTSGTKEALQAFIDAYNALRDFVITNQTISSDGAVSDDAVLFSDSLMENLNDMIAGLLGSSFDSDLSTLASIGITYDSDNKLQISDEMALDDAILENYQAIVDLFSTHSESSDDTFRMLSNTSSVGSLDVTFDITVDSEGKVSSVTANGQSDMFTISGTLITGKAGTIYEGLSFSYQGGANASVNFSLNQGLADRLYNGLTDYTDTSSGLIAQQKTQLESTNDKLTDEAATIRENAENYRTRLINKYAAMEAKIQSLKSLQEQIRAILGYTDSSNG